jgi:hypothetical protein
LEQAAEGVAVVMKQQVEIQAQVVAEVVEVLLFN